MRFRSALIGCGLLTVGGLLSSPFIAMLGIGVIVAGALGLLPARDRQEAPEALPGAHQPSEADCQPLPDVPWRSLVRSYVEWGNTRVEYLGRVEGNVRGCTEDAALALALGWTLEHGRYTGTVPNELGRQIVHEDWQGELDGETVNLIAESDEYYRVTVAGGAVISRWQFCRSDKLEWEGAVPKDAFSRVWCSTRRFDC